MPSDNRGHLYLFPKPIKIEDSTLFAFKQWFVQQILSFILPLTSSSD